MLDQQTKQQLKTELPKFKSQLKQRFPEIEDGDLKKAQSDPDDFVRAVARKSGQDESMVERQVEQLVLSGR